MATINKIQGSVFLHASGKWSARRRYTTNGVKKEWQAYFDTEKEAEKALLAFNKSLLTGKAQLSNDSLGQFLDEVLAKVYKPKLRPSTYRLYEGFCKNHLASLKTVKLSRLTVEQLEAIFNSRPKLSSNRHAMGVVSRRTLRTFVIGALNHAVRWGRVTENIALRTQLAERPKTRVIKALTVEQVQRLLEKSEDPFRTIFLLQATTGCRIGEVVGLKWTDLEADVIQVQRQIQRSPSGTFKNGKEVSTLQEQPLKTDQSKRRITILPEVLERIEALPKHGDYLFSTAKGTPFDPRNILRALYIAADKAGLEKIGTHVLRHSYASLQVSAGTDLIVIKDSLGHTDIRVTQIYATTQIEPIRTANKKLGILLFGEVEQKDQARSEVPD